ncbi:MAG: hypothetical protein A2X59_06800 [Nitrospirae bacterium GWC2_42_7]|nr:MAG: hypothetical protein A2X59_06800 [Nitrospirae bacterium GWC2_42_7]
MIKLKAIKEKYNFEPKYTFSELQQNLPQRFESKIQDSILYKALETLAVMAYPTETNKFEKRWNDFYLPFKRKGYFMLVPLSIILYEKKFFLSIHNSLIEVSKNNEERGFLGDLIEQTIKFSRTLKKNPGLVIEALPYDIRTGRVLGKYVLERLLSAGEKEKILKLYREHIEKQSRSDGVSLDNYLNTAAICYKAAFGSKVKGLTAEQMYRKWADDRDCGMLKIKNRTSKKAFKKWLDSESHCGCHPFEIVFSWLNHGIHLYPPYTGKEFFTLRLSNYMYASPFLEMVRALIISNLPFEAYELEKVLDYLTGNSYFTVNSYSEHNILYDPGNRKFFKHIEWDEPNILKWK